VPVGIAVIVGAVAWVPESRERHEIPGLDVLGAVLSAFALGLLVFGIIEATTLGWWREKAPLTVGGRDLHGPAGLSLSPLLLAVGTLEAGLVLAAMAGGAFLSGTLARHLAAAIGAPGTVLVGLGAEVLAVGALALALRPESPVLLIVGLLVPYGLGLGLASAQLTSTVLAPVPPEQSGQGSATQSTVRQLGTALGTAVAGALLAAGLAARTGALEGEAAQLGAQLTASSGSILPQLRAEGMDPRILDQLDLVFTDGTRIAMSGAAMFLLLGLVGAVAVRRAARSAPTEGDDAAE